MNLSDTPEAVLILVFTAVIIVSGFLVLSGITSETACPSGYEWNGTGNYCHEATNVSAISGATYAGNSSTSIQEGLDNITDYASTWGTIIGVAILLGIVIGGFSFGRSKGFF